MLTYVSKSSFDVRVDGEQTVQALVNLGAYDFIIFPESVSEDKVSTTFKKMIYVSFARQMTTADISAKIRKRRLTPATMRDILCFGIQFPKEQFKHTVVALNAKVEESEQVKFVCLCSENHKKARLVIERDLPWDKGTKFLCSCD